MEAIIFMGIPGSGKSSFYRDHFFSTHVRISLDQLKTRARETRFLEACLQTGQKFVVDNTNPSREERTRYLNLSKPAGFSVIGYYFASPVNPCLQRNADRTPAEWVPDVAILSAARRLQRPSLEEGFNQLFYVSLQQREFLVKEWNDEL
ncbi:hypothetical protein Pan153_43060 [Gimesia panareensis]|uniref:ATP-binding protein n=1 Tax=Gimesia panareensis TaxID=2527978 RepID=A0A518FTI6_9PLAN|nr:AAA family ATPase [Gimesia panareensis]QDV19640.1 hypothetical protein Pan153_43060 [Gimesia panareensis]